MANRPISISVYSPSPPPPELSLWIVPDHLVEAEGDLLLGLEADDVGDLAFLDRRQLDETRQAALPRHADGHDVAAQIVARQERLQGVADQFVRLGIGLAEDLGILDVIEMRGDKLAFDVLQAEGLEGTLADVDAPGPKGGALELLLGFGLLFPLAFLLLGRFGCFLAVVLGRFGILVDGRLLPDGFLEFAVLLVDSRPGGRLGGAFSVSGFPGLAGSLCRRPESRLGGRFLHAGLPGLAVGLAGGPGRRLGGRFDTGFRSRLGIRLGIGFGCHMLPSP